MNVFSHCRRSFPRRTELPPTQPSGLQPPTFTQTDKPAGTGLASLLGELAHPLEGQRGPTQLVSGAFDPASRFPAKVVARIEGLEFVEMSELLQESWATDCSESKLNHGRRDPVTDILVWAECFTGMAAILSPKFSQKAPELLAYMWLIIHADRKYDGAAWVTYDRVYKRQAVARHSLDWS